MGPITDAERLGWQRRAVRVLTELLARAQRDGLPVMRWTVQPLAGLVASVDSKGAAQRRADWDAWRRVLGARPWPEHTSSGGTTYLHAVAEHIDGLVTVAVLAELYDEEAGR
jgi:hypothetical protein